VVRPGAIVDFRGGAIFKIAIISTHDSTPYRKRIALSKPGRNQALLGDAVPIPKVVEVFMSITEEHFGGVERKSRISFGLANLKNLYSAAPSLPPHRRQHLLGGRSFRVYLLRYGSCGRHIWPSHGFKSIIATAACQGMATGAIRAAQEDVKVNTLRSSPAKWRPIS